MSNSAEARKGLYSDPNDIAGLTTCLCYLIRPKPFASAIRYA